MTRLMIIILFATAVGFSPALACIEECKQGEFYSDEAEMCVAEEAA